MLSVNQMNAQIKLTEIWKAMNQQNCPLKITRASINESERNTRSITAWKLIEKGKTELLQSTYINDGSKFWNMSPNEVTKSPSLWSAKKAIKAFVKTLPM